MKRGSATDSIKNIFFICYSLSLKILLIFFFFFLILEKQISAYVCFVASYQIILKRKDLWKFICTQPLHFSEHVRV